MSNDAVKKRLTVLIVITLLFAASVPFLWSFIPNVVVVNGQQYPREDSYIFSIPKVTGYDNHNWWSTYTGLHRDMGFHPLIQECLFYYILTNDTFIPWLGESYAYNEDYTKITVELRDDVYWSDGVKFTADDCIFTLDMVSANPEMFTAGEYGPDRLTSWTKLSDYSFEIVLAKPDPHWFFDNLVAIVNYAFSPVPKHIWEQEEDLVAFTNPIPFVHAGPYDLTTAQEELLVFELRDDWWAWDVKIPGYVKDRIPQYVIGKYVGEQDQVALAAQNGELDFCGLPASIYQTISQQNDKLELIVFKDVANMMLFFQHNRYPFNNKDVRWALAYAIDQQEIIDVVLEGYSFKAYSPYNSANGGAFMPLDLFTQYNCCEYDPQLTEQMFTDLGWTKGTDGVWLTENGTRCEWEIICHNNPNAIATSEMIVDYWTDVGIDVVYSVIETMVYVEYSEGQHVYDVFHAHTIGPRNPADPLRWWLHFDGRSSHGWWVRYNSSEFNALIDQATAMNPLDPAYKDVQRDLFEIYLEDCLAIGIYESPRLNVINTEYWTNWPIPGETDRFPPYVGFLTAKFYHMELRQVEAAPPPPPPPDYTLYAGVAVVAVVVVAALFFLRRR